MTTTSIALETLQRARQSQLDAAYYERLWAERYSRNFEAAQANAMNAQEAADSLRSAIVALGGLPDEYRNPEQRVTDRLAAEAEANRPQEPAA